MGQSNFDAMPYAEQANDILGDALEAAIPYSEGYTNEAINVQKKALQDARIEAEASFQRAQGLSAPYRLAGYQALDQYMDTLTVARPEMGSFKLATSLENQAMKDAAEQRVKNLAGDVTGNFPFFTGPGTGNYKGAPRLTPEENKLRYLAQEAGTGPTYDKFGNRVTQGGLPEYASLTGQTANSIATGNYDTTSQLSPKLQEIQNWYLQHGGFDATDRNQLDFLQYFAEKTPGLLATGKGAIGKPDEYFLTPEVATGLNKAYKDINAELNRYQSDVKYWTPEMGSIAAGFRKGLLSDARWVDV